MSDTQSLDAIDQAAGLRYLFGNSTAPVHVLCCPSRPALSLPLVDAMSKELAHEGQTILWVDEIALNDREHWPLPCTVKFDLSKSLESHVALDQGVTALGSSLWYGLSLHTHRITRPALPLAERLISSGIRFDSILVSAATGKPESFARYGAQLHMTAISGCAPEQLQQTLAWMQQAQAKCTAASWRVVLAGESEQLTHAIHWLAQTVKAHLSQEVQVLGTVSVERLSAPLVGAWTGLPELTEVLKRHLLTN
jgi:hypothetical protein